MDIVWEVDEYEEHGACQHECGEESELTQSGGGQGNKGHEGSYGSDIADEQGAHYLTQSRAYITLMAEVVDEV